MAGRIFDTELKEFDATTLDGTYQNLGSVLSNPALKVMFLNTSDVDAYISVDGLTNKFRLPSGSALTFDESTSKMPNKGQEYYLSAGDQLTVTQVTGAASSGNIIAHLVTRTL